jgi:hypothetical protein
MDALALTKSALALAAGTWRHQAPYLVGGYDALNYTRHKPQRYCRLCFAPHPVWQRDVQPCTSGILQAAEVFFGCVRILENPNPTLDTGSSSSDDSAFQRHAGEADAIGLSS